MSRKNIYPILVVLLVLAVSFTLSSCDKLRVSRLQANHHFSRANHNFTEQKYRSAIEEYEKALSYNPELVEAHRFLGESYKSLYKPGVDNERNNEIAQNALAALTKAYEIESENKQVIHSLGDMYDKMRDFVEAEKLFLTM